MTWIEDRLEITKYLAIVIVEVYLLTILLYLVHLKGETQNEKDSIVTLQLSRRALTGAGASG